MNWTKTNAMIINNNKRKHDNNILINFKFGEQVINIVNDVKLLGIHFDNKLEFNLYCNDICKKINSKLFRLKKHSYLFTNEFKSILFKLFNLPIFDYCSSLFITMKVIYFKKLLKSFSKASKELLNIDIYNKQLLTQQSLLKPVNVSPLILRLFNHYCIFVFKLFSLNNAPSIQKFFF